MLTLLLTAALAAEPETVLREGDALPSGEEVERLAEFAIGPDGRWTAGVRLVGGLSALVEDDGSGARARLIEGDPMPLGGGTFQGMTEARFTRDGSFLAFYRRDAPTAQGFHLDDAPVLLQAEPITDPAADPPAIVGGLWDAHAGEADTIYVSVNDIDPNLPIVYRYHLLRLTPVVGGGWDQEVVRKVGEQLPGMLAPLSGAWLGDYDVTPGGALFWVGRETTFNARDNDALWRDTTLLAREGQPWPADPSIAMFDLAGARAVPNAHDDFLFLFASAVRKNDVLSLGLDTPVLVTGQPMPRGPSAPVAEVGYGALAFGDNGTWVTRVRLDGPPTHRDEALVVNHRVLVTEGQALPGGGTLVGLPELERELVLSPDGRWLLGLLRAETPAGDLVERLTRWDLSDTLEPIEPIPAGPGMLTFGVDHAIPGHTVILAAGTSDTGLAPSCDGQPLPLSLGGTVRVLASATADARGRVRVDVPIPSSASGLTVHLQAVDRTTCAAGRSRTATL